MVRACRNLTLTAHDQTQVLALLHVEYFCTVKFNRIWAANFRALPARSVVTPGSIASPIYVVRTSLRPVAQLGPNLSADPGSQLGPNAHGSQASQLRLIATETLPDRSLFVLCAAPGGAPLPRGDCAA